MVIKLFKLSGIILVVFIIFAATISVSKNESVRLRIAMDGHPVIALKYNPTRSPFLSQQMNVDIYMIAYKYNYDHLGMAHVVLFKIKTIFIFHNATSTY